MVRKIATMQLGAWSGWFGRCACPGWVADGVGRVLGLGVGGATWSVAGVKGFPRLRVGAW